MYLLKRKVRTLETKVTAPKIVELGGDTVVLGSLLLDAEHERNFYIEDTLTISASARIIGNITATRCIIEGRVIGDIICAEDLQLGASAIIEGTIITKTSIMEAGCIINGKVMLNPDLKVSLLSLKIAEAKNYSERESTDTLPDLAKELGTVKKDSIIFQNAHNMNKEPQVVRKQSSVNLEPTNQTDNWW
ncbi:polymer-forming cytoskeletal protein [Dysgonomonas sp. Marseille-P4677]|uniref:polymer-forming cytoskeletal protein n=1 Tax=Dysgonomonas sp. Marseille-P4677 TaxID=2364790 RepID=UPI001911DE9A|nr:polymer-forming cytoskeletal protein [Dysgonomonas sp. Marseille-P4677]MBK5720908.1 polymer-forming cytoskeletal protein [Dysgonomonas sp. Marseille-P4677]